MDRQVCCAPATPEDRHRRLRRAVCCALVFVGVCAGCSSIPDVTFADAEAPLTQADAGADGSVEAASDGSSGYACPGNAPPPNVGVCCGTRLCLRCQPADCGRCEDAQCRGTSANGRVCCKRMVRMTCDEADDCR